MDGGKGGGEIGWQAVSVLTRGSGEGGGTLMDSFITKMDGGEGRRLGQAMAVRLVQK